MKGIANVNPFNISSSTGANLLTILQSGYIGIGTSSPTYMLSLKSQANVNPFQIASSSGSDMLVLDTVGRFGIATSSPNYTFDMKGIANVNPFNISSSTGANLFTILQNGNVGIGTSTPGSKLSLTGTSPNDVLQIASSSGASMLAINSGGLISFGLADNSSTSMTISEGSNAYFTFDTSDSAEKIIFGKDLEIGPLNIDANSGAVNFANMDITSLAPTSSAQSLSIALDGSPVLTAYTEAQGANGQWQNSRVGIATTSPVAMLSIAGNASTSGPMLMIASSTLDIMTVMGNGLVGIGTTTPTSSLEVYRLATSTLTITTASSSAVDPILSFRTGANPSENFKMFVDDSDSDKLVIATSTSSNILTITQNALMGIGTSTPTGIFSIATSTGAGLFHVDKSGNVGISSSSPVYLLSMESSGGGYYDVSDHQWHNGSTRAIKQDISTLAVNEEEELLRILNQLEITKFRFITDVQQNGSSAIWYYGVIADTTTTPDFLTGQGRNGLSSGGAIQYLLSVAQALNKKIDKLEATLANPTSTSYLTVKETITGQLTVELTPQSLKTALSGLGLQVSEDGSLSVVKLQTQQLEVGTQERPGGVTLYDKNTKQPYCLEIIDGQVKTTSGKCQIPYILQQSLNQVFSETSNPEIAPFPDPEPQNVEAPSMEISPISESAPESPAQQPLLEESAPTIEFIPVSEAQNLEDSGTELIDSSN
jgi:hypothetical protein